MNNKEEKTFSDIFSSSETKENKEPSFSSIVNTEKENNTEEIKEENKVNNPITFDSIFDDISKEEKEPKENYVIENPKIEINLDLNKKLKKETEDATNGIEKSYPVTKEEDFMEEQNIFFSDSVLTPKEGEIPTNGEQQISEQPKPIENPFELNDSNKIEKSLEVEEDLIKPEETTTNNPFFNESSKFIDEEKSDEVVSNIENPFNESSLKKDITLNDNPFFAMEQQKTSVTESTTSSTEKETQKSISPFFQEEKPQETENPFFQNQINLVENKTHDKPITSVNIKPTKHYNVKIVKKKDSPLKFILGVFSYALFIFLLLIGITLLVYVLDIKIRAAKGDYSTPTFNAYVVLTGSMLPEIEVNDVVVTKKVDVKTLNERDIITFASADSRFQGTIITHRIIKKNPPDGNSGYTFQTKGDNNNVADSALVPENNIYGKVILKIPKLGYLQEFLASDGGWIIVILIPCLTVISYDIVKLIKGLKRKKYKNIKVQK